jgi:hypothetical protein
MAQSSRYQLYMFLQLIIEIDRYERYRHAFIPKYHDHPDLSPLFPTMMEGLDFHLEPFAFPAE